MLADVDLAAVGRMLGDTHRSHFLLDLLGGDELTAGALAIRSGASSSLASAHLGKLLEAGLIGVRRSGRQRLYRLTGPEVAQAIEALLAIAPPHPAAGLRDSSRGEAIRRARTCYDHLAGRLGVALADAFEHRCIIRSHGDRWVLTNRGERELAEFGLDLGELRRRRRAFLRPCLDWSERRPHVAGALGAGVAARFLELDWVRRLPDSRALSLTPAGEAELRARFSVQLNAPAGS